jgi:hypothetical protein
MSETVVLRTIGGPHPGSRYVDTATMPWPLPDKLPDENGYYRKTSESQLPPQTRDSHVMRGAEYHWIETDDVLV